MFKGVCVRVCMCISTYASTCDTLNINTSLFLSLQRLWMNSILLSLLSILFAITQQNMDWQDYNSDERWVQNPRLHPSSYSHNFLTMMLNKVFVFCGWHCPFIFLFPPSSSHIQVPSDEHPGQGGRESCFTLGSKKSSLLSGSWPNKV